MNGILVVLPLIIIPATIIIIVMLLGRSAGNRNENYYQGDRTHGRLCRSQSNRILAGVCGGIAEHFGWNATVVRLFFIFTGIGVLTYIILAIVIPDSDTPLL